MRNLLIITLLFVSLSAFSQQKVWVFFKDKKISNNDWKHPEKYLSEKSLERRARQNIELHSSDFPVNRNYINALREKGFQRRGSRFLQTLFRRCEKTCGRIQGVGFSRVH